MPALDRFVIVAAARVGLFFLPAMVAEYLGYYKDEGLEVEIVDLGSGGKALQALVGGSVDVTSGAYDHTVQLAAKKIPLQAFVLQASLADYAVGVVKSKAASYKSPRDRRECAWGSRRLAPAATCSSSWSWPRRE